MTYGARVASLAQQGQDNAAVYAYARNRYAPCEHVIQPAALTFSATSVCVSYCLHVCLVLSSLHPMPHAAFKDWSNKMHVAQLSIDCHCSPYHCSRNHGGKSFNVKCMLSGIELVRPLNLQNLGLHNYVSLQRCLRLRQNTTTDQQGLCTINEGC